MKRRLGFAHWFVAVVVASAIAAPVWSQSTLVRQGRWLTINGQYLVGFDTQELAADRTFNFLPHLQTMQSKGINKVRIWLYNYFMEDPSTPAAQSALFPWAFDRATRKFNFDA